ncbi:MAG TPA: DUF2087 domain-containing protein [Chroococcidiopsis sp.]
MIDLTALKPYLDAQGRITQWPSKRNRSRVQTLVLWYLAEKFVPGITYTEQQVNAILNQHHTFNDPALLRRELFDHGLINRARNGSAYWLPPGEAPAIAAPVVAAAIDCPAIQPVVQAL